MKKTFATIYFLCSFSFLFAQTELEKLTKRVDVLESALSNLLWVGLPVLGLTTLWAAYMWFKGIKSTVNGIIEKDADKKLEAKAKELVEEKLKNYPFIEEYERILKIKKEKNILILGKIAKDIQFVERIKAGGFKNVNSKLITETEDVDPNQVDVILFDNRKGDLSQSEMDKIVFKFKNQVHFFYQSGQDGALWKSTHTNFGKIGFASNTNTLEHNLTKLFT